MEEMLQILQEKCYKQILYLLILPQLSMEEILQTNTLLITI